MPSDIYDTDYLKLAIACKKISSFRSCSATRYCCYKTVRSSILCYVMLGSVQVLYMHVRGERGDEGSKGNAYFAYVGGLEEKCLYCLCKGSKFLFT